MSTFVAYQTDSLILSTFPKPTNSLSAQSTPSADTDQLNTLLLALRPPLSPSKLRETVHALQTLQTRRAGLATEEDDAVKVAVLGRLTVGVYAEALSVYLAQASEAEKEAEWWNDIERSRWNALWYLLQTLPSRLINLTQILLQTIRSESQSISLSTSQITPSSILHALRTLAHNAHPLRPNLLTTSLFPHLHTDPHLLTSLSLPLPSTVSTTSLRNTLTTWLRTVLHCLTLPVSLTHRECTLKRKQLQKIRDQKAERLGALSSIRPWLENALKEASEPKLTEFANVMQSLITSTARPPSPSLEGFTPIASESPLLTTLSTLTTHTPAPLPVSLHRPPRLTLLWPRLVLGPPLAFYAVKQVWASRESLSEVAAQAVDTMRAFWTGWIVEPVRDIVRTVRAGGEGGVIVRQEGVQADLQSLERMVLSLAREKLAYDTAQLEELASKVRLGDLTPVMEIYEQDIKSPIKSAVAGTLVRSLFVQVQKAKVDIDQALSGIDKLLKSQELTFAFVGVAPALAIVYGGFGALTRLWSGGRGRGRFGGLQRRESVLADIRRIERLLIFQPKSSSSPSSPPASGSPEIPPLTAGLLLLSLTHLRQYGEAYLPKGRVREGFLEDVGDLEEPGLGRREKLRVVERMWRCWGGVLGWGAW